MLSVYLSLCCKCSEHCRFLFCGDRFLLRELDCECSQITGERSHVAFVLLVDCRHPVGRNSVESVQCTGDCAGHARDRITVATVVSTAKDRGLQIAAGYDQESQGDRDFLDALHAAWGPVVGAVATVERLKGADIVRLHGGPEFRDCGLPVGQRACLLDHRVDGKLGAFAGDSLGDGNHRIDGGAWFECFGNRGGEYSSGLKSAAVLVGGEDLDRFPVRTFRDHRR